MMPVCPRCGSRCLRAPAGDIHWYFCEDEHAFIPPSEVATATPRRQPAAAPPPTSGLVSATGVPITQPVDPCAEALVDWPAFWATERRGEDWLVEPLLPRGRSIATHSKAKQGKSLLSLDVAA